jgi:hypothetical protein
MGTVESAEKDKIKRDEMIIPVKRTTTDKKESGSQFKDRRVEVIRVADEPASYLEKKDSERRSF